MIKLFKEFFFKIFSRKMPESEWEKEWMRRNHQYFVDDDLPLKNINKHILEER